MKNTFQNKVISIEKKCIAHISCLNKKINIGEHALEPKYRKQIISKDAKI